MINRLITALRWEEHQVLALPFDRACSLLAYWGRRPPTNELLEIWLEVQTTWKRRERPGSERFRESTIEDFANFAAAMGVPIHVRN